MSETQDVSGWTESKLKHIAAKCEEFAEEIEAGEYEAAHEAADAIGSDDGNGCPVCERLSSSLAAAVAYSMWFPDTEESAEIASEAADRARRHADDVRDELPPGGGGRGA